MLLSSGSGSDDGVVRDGIDRMFRLWCVASRVVGIR